MINVNDYIKLLLKKKKWSNKQLCEELNKIEAKLGDSRTTPQNITNYLNGQHNIRPKWLAKVEVALNLPQNTLISMVNAPATKEAKKELNELIKKAREVKGYNAKKN